jgi:hypothetical protein
VVFWKTKTGVAGLPLLAMVLCASCARDATDPAAAGEDPATASCGSIEVTAQLVEVPEGAIFKRELYNYATILKYQVLRVHRGAVTGDTIYVGHYNPFRPRRDAADARVKGIGGNLDRFEAGQIHRMALEVPIEDHFMGGIVNKYFGKTSEPLYWAVWTNSASE